MSTLAVLTGTSVSTLPEALSTLFSPLAAAAFLVFTLLYTPCVAAIAAVKRELGGVSAGVMVVYQTGVAWLVACLVFNVGRLLGLG